MRYCSALLLLAIACGDDDGRVDAGGDGGTDASSDASIDVPIFDAEVDGGDDAGADAGADGGSECPRVPAPADRVRQVVISHPYPAPSMVYEVFELDQSGELSRPGTTFELGRSTGGEIVFTPDGEVGLVAQEDGTLGVFRFTEDGVEVVHAAYDGEFYAAGVIPAADGTGAWVRDAQWRESGGGLYWVEIGCDGSIAAESLVAASKLPYAWLPRGDGTAVLFGRDVLDTVEGDDDGFIVDLAGPSVTAAGDIFPDSDWIGAGADLTADGTFALIGDNGLFTTNRVAIARLGETSITGTQIIEPLEDPIAIVASPTNDAAIVASGFGNAIFRLTYDGDADPAWTNAGELTYVGARPALPGSAVAIETGPLVGLVLVAENVGIRRVRFSGGGAVEDLGAFDLGEGIENVVGAIGVQP